MIGRVERTGFPPLLLQNAPGVGRGRFAFRGMLEWGVEGAGAMEIFRLSRSGCLITLVSVLPAIVATVQSVNYRRPSSNFCGGRSEHPSLTSRAGCAPSSAAASPLCRGTWTFAGHVVSFGVAYALVLSGEFG